MLLDAGCSGGTGILVLTCLTNCTSIGIDIDDTRVALANLHSKSIMANKRIDQDIKVCFAERDITQMQNLNGVTVLYLYDSAFDKRQHDLVVAAIVASDSLRCFISSQKIDFYRPLGLTDDWNQTDDVQMTQIGGNCERTLFIYSKCKETCDNGCSIPDEFIANLLNCASNRELRREYVDTAHNTWLKSKDYIRSSKIPADKDHCIAQSHKLFNLLATKTYFTNSNIGRFHGQDTLTQELCHFRSKYR